MTKTNIFLTILVPMINIESPKKIPSIVSGGCGRILRNKVDPQHHRTYICEMETDTEMQMDVEVVAGSDEDVDFIDADDPGHDLAKEGHPVLFFSFRQIIDANHKPFNLLCNWLSQILECSPPFKKILKAYVDEKSDTRRALGSVGRNDLWMHLKTALAQTVDRVYLVADALEEMDSGNDEFLQELAILGSWKPDKVKVLIASRPVTTVEEPLRRMPTLQIRLEERFVDTVIAIFIRIKEAVPGRANDLFLYAKLAMDAFLKPNADIHQILNALPLNLNAMYTDLLREHAHRSCVSGGLQLLILSWVTHATHPLRLLELAAIIRTTYGDTGMEMKEAKQLARAACGPFLEMQPDETVSVIHHSI
ncbi:hypothetical protein QBC36DRAFT_365657 [Triangularia setosa]|uniref:Nephrocystin 3-like N-terminal domain-containing protein n=1 Tax=Triangularia setosa TaxID=2587417 RepID=A0AAN6VYN8_9PEZI|nr:hypothetical protein QBC36DRAFT_365657 [Podospora setosa]